MTSKATTYILSMDTLKTIGQGALGAMTFGAYHQYTTNKIMELNNEKDELKHQHDMNVLNDKINKLEQNQKSRWW
jgi:hypothetical protein